MLLFTLLIVLLAIVAATVWLGTVLPQRDGITFVSLVLFGSMVFMVGMATASVLDITPMAGGALATVVMLVSFAVTRVSTIQAARSH